MIEQIGTALVPYRMLLLIGIAFSIFGILVIIFVAAIRRIIGGVQERKAIISEEELLKTNWGEASLLDKNKAMRQVVAPNGVDPNINSYLILNDGGKDIYIRCFSIVAMPKRTVFARTFTSLLNFGNCSSAIFIEPLSEAESSRTLDKHVVILEGEAITAEKARDRNRHRKISQQLHETESWATAIETGENKFFNVGFGFAIWALSVAELDSQTDAFVAAARDKNIDVTSCFAVQAEAFQSISCLNRRFNLSFGPIKSDTIKMFLMDQRSLSTIFNYNQNVFQHENGTYLGQNMSDGSAVLFDPFDRSHNGYNMIIAGMTGSGKSLTTKILSFRMAIDTRFVAIDSQRPSGSIEGEYCGLARAVNGIVYTVSPGSGTILNIFEIGPTKKVELDSNGAVADEWLSLEVKSKVADVSYIIMLMITGGAYYAGTTMKFEDMVYMSEQITIICTQLYADRGIVEGDVNSLYREITVTTNTGTHTERIVKNLPTFTDFYKKLLLAQQEHRTEEVGTVYRLMLAALREYVTELYYTPVEVRFFTREEYEATPVNENGIHYDPVTGEPISSIIGIRSYFDGQSTIRLSKSTRFTNIDLSGLPESEMNVARMVAITFVNESFVKTNSEDPRKIERMVVILDEVDKMWKNEYCKQLIASLYRTARKKNCGCWVITQSLTDFGDDESTRTIFENTSSMLLFKHQFSTKEYLQKKINITDSQMATLVELGGDREADPELKRRHRGEMCVVDSGHVYFVKVAYLKEVEGLIAETDAEQRARMLKNSK